MFFFTSIAAATKGALGFLGGAFLRHWMIILPILLIVGGIIYINHLRSSLDDARAEAALERERRYAAADTLRDLGSYVVDLERRYAASKLQYPDPESVYVRVPVYIRDQIDRDGGEPTDIVTITYVPDADSIQGTIAPVGLWRWAIEDTVALNRVDLRLTVNPANQHLTYDLLLDPLPRTLTIVRAMTPLDAQTMGTTIYVEGPGRVIEIEGFGSPTAQHTRPPPRPFEVSAQVNAPLLTDEPTLHAGIGLKAVPFPSTFSRLSATGSVSMDVRTNDIGAQVGLAMRLY